MNKTTLIVDDEPDICQLLRLTLAKMNVASETALTLCAAKKQLETKAFDLCLTDLRLPDGNGLDLVHDIQCHYPHLPVAVITAHGNMETAIQAMKLGAFDFINKPLDIQLLRNLVENALNINKDMANTLQLIGESDCILKLREQISKIGRSQAPVYISGPSGAGKELVARLIHENSPRRDHPFIPVNCGAIPLDLMESEFFGHKKGSFTGAHQDQMGFFQAAHQGTLFLDEVADLPLNMQVKLLRSIQDKTYRPIGETKELTANVRFLCATHKNLSELVQIGKFREDLFYRINVIEIQVPSLAERKSDLTLLVPHILKKIIPPNSTFPNISQKALEALSEYSFPGNIRELENILERSYTLCDGQNITEKDLQLPKIQQGNAALNTFDKPLDETLQELEKEVILKALKKTQGNRTLAAKLLGISFRTLRYRLDKLGLDNEKD